LGRDELIYPTRSLDKNALIQPQSEFARSPERPLGEGLTAEKMKNLIWLKPVLVAAFEFLEWTPDDYLRHAKFVALRNDKKPYEVVRERSVRD
jgi:ATP-dependent DNA ligase